MRLLSLLAPLLFFASEAAAQDAVGFDPSKPTEIDGGRVERLEGGRILIGEGNMRIAQPGVVLTAARMEITIDPATSEVERLVATGRVRYANVEGDAIAGDRAVYTASDNLLEVGGNVVVLQGQQVATSDTLTYNTITGAMVMSSNPGSRVRGLLVRSDEG